jgi:hypothetical protein
VENKNKIKTKQNKNKTKQNKNILLEKYKKYK